MTIQVPSGRNLQEQLIKPLNLQVKGISIMHSVMIEQARGSILFGGTIVAQTLWRTKWSSPYTKWNLMLIIYIFIVTNLIVQ